MVTRRLRSEYMKKFKDPKWETYTKCYEETLKYRLNRRLLEQTHNPWFWSGSDTDSDSGGRSPLPPPNDKVRAEPCTAGAEAEDAQGLGPDGPVPRLPLQDEVEEVHVSTPQAVINGKNGAKGTQEEVRVSSRDKQLRIPQNQKEQGNSRNDNLFIYNRFFFFFLC